MNTNAISTRLAVALVVATLGIGISRAFATGNRLAIVGRDGQVLSFSDSLGKKPLASLHAALPPGRRIHNTYCVPSERTLLVSTVNGNLYKLDLSAVASGYQRISTENEYVGYPFYNRKEKRPAWLHRGDEGSNKAIRCRGTGGRIHRSQPNDIEFTCGFVFGLHIDGWKTSRELAAMGSDLAGLPARYPNDQWIIVGRSEHIAAYLRKPAVPVKIGEPVTATIVLEDRIRDQWKVVTMDEYCQVSVFAEVAVFRGMYDIKGDKHPDTGNYVQQKPSGNWYFYEPQEHRITVSELDPSLTVHYATAGNAIISGNGQLLTLSLDASEHDKPEPLGKLPTGFTVATVCPF